MSTSASVTLELPFRPPYDWPRVLRFLAGRATPGVEAVEDGVWRRAFEWNGDSGTLAVHKHPRRRCIVATIDGPASRHADSLLAPIARVFDLHADAAAIGASLAADPWLAPLVSAAPGLRVPGAWSAFELVVRAIVGQQVSVKAATTILGRIVQRAGARIEGHAHQSTAWRFPAPASLAGADLSQIGMPGKRIDALQGFARAVASGKLLIEPDAEAATDAALLRASLLALPGIGSWTVEYVAMRAWRDADAWPESDLVLMQSIAARDPTLVRPVQQRVRTEAWRPWRAYAAMHLWNEIADRAAAARGG